MPAVKFSFVFALLAVTLVAVEAIPGSRPTHDPKGLPVAPIPAFPCQPFEYRVDDYPTPTNVNQLRPHDIKVVMSMGDSITAAFGAISSEFITEAPYIPRESRYLSYAGGGGSMRYTLPNFIKVFNRHSVGGADGYTLPIDDMEYDGQHIIPYLNQNSLLNGALSGAEVQDIPHEIDYLVNELKTTYADSVDFDNDWKLATLLIGANNICGSCKNRTEDQPEQYEADLRNSLQYLYEQIPRVRLNLLPMFNIAQVYDWAMSYEYCTRMWNTVSSSECSCITDNSTQEDREITDTYAAQYREITLRVAEEWNAKNLTDFAVAYQPFTENLKIINGDLLSDFDCFHPSALSHAYFAAGLWNSMMLPPDQKPHNATAYMVEGFDWICPTRDQYLQ